MTDDIRFSDQPKRTGTIKIVWGDGEHTFRLPYDQLVELQEKLQQGPMKTLLNFESGDWTPQSVYEIMRLGLIGGGKSPVEALRLAKAYVLDRPLGESSVPAAAVLSAALMGVPVTAPEPVNG